MEFGVEGTVVGMVVAEETVDDELGCGNLGPLQWRILLPLKR